jgi:hypothetical protein
MEHLLFYLDFSSAGDKSCIPISCLDCNGHILTYKKKKIEGCTDYDELMLSYLPAMAPCLLT